jgi:hypothetical protein
LGDFIDEEPREISPEELGFSISAEERKWVSEYRDCMAQEMWDDYVAHLAMPHRMNQKMCS